MGRQDPAAYGEWSHATWDATPIAVTVAAAQNRSVVLKMGVHRFISTVNCYIKQGTSSVAATAAFNDSHFILANTPTPVRVTDVTENGYLSVIRASGDGSSQITHLVGAG